MHMCFSNVAGLLLGCVVTAAAAYPTILPLSGTQPIAPGHFAVSIPHVADSRSSGEWTIESDHMIWRHALQVPGARSMSLAATAVSLPSGSELRIGDLLHDEKDIVVGTLWSRPVLGELLEIEARVPIVSVAEFHIAVEAVQAGLPQVLGIRAKAASDIKNYECSKAAANERQGRAVVGLIAANVASCTGTLINNGKRDRAPLILTAAHCAGTVASNSASAASMRIYYNESTPCGLSPGEWEGELTTMGATSLGAKDDVWLLRANNAVPKAANPYWVGWDATDAEVGPNTFGIHHGEMRDKQFVASNKDLVKNTGAAVAGTLLTPFSQIWEFAPTEGDIERGASGSSIFNPQGLTVGTLSGSSANGCGASNGGRYCAQYQRLAYGFSALQSALDPENTGVTSLPGFPADPPKLQFASNKANVKPGESVVLTWGSSEAFSCNASGDWVGSMALQGSETRALQKLGSNTFSLECNGDGGKVSKSVTVTVANANAAPSSSSPAPTPVSTSAAPSSAGASGGGAFGSSLLILWPLWRLLRKTRRYSLGPFALYL